jgi:hypothetical protein
MQSFQCLSDGTYSYHYASKGTYLYRCDKHGLVQSRGLPPDDISFIVKHSNV